MDRARQEGRPCGKENAVKRAFLRAWALTLALALVPAAAGAEDASDVYNPRSTGHPLRIVAYILHPVGYTLDKLIFHPAWRFSHWGPMRPIFGVPRALPVLEVEPAGPQAPQGS